MTGRVPDAAGDWYWGTSAEDWAVLHLTDRDLGPALPSRVDGRWVSPWEYVEECRDIRHPGRWLGPVAPPCPEGRVRVEMSRDAAAWWCDRLPVATSYQGDVVKVLREIRDALRTALAKGAE